MQRLQQAARTSTSHSQQRSCRDAMMCTMSYSRSAAEAHSSSRCRAASSRGRFAASQKDSASGVSPHAPCSSRD